MIGLKVPKNNADKIRRLLLNKSLINLDLKIKAEDKFVYIPLTGVPDNKFMYEYENLNIEVVDTEFKIHKKSHKSLKDYLRK